MTKLHLGPLSSDSAARDAVLEDVRGLDQAQRSVASDAVDDSSPLPGAVRDQLARDIAEIESATAALRRAEPALESWTNTPAKTVGKPRPLWLLIGVLWISTALVTVGAVVAIHALVG
jgi:hypothetical protein